MSSGRFNEVKGSQRMEVLFGCIPGGLTVRSKVKQAPDVLIQLHIVKTAPATKLSSPDSSVVAMGSQILRSRFLD